MPSPSWSEDSRIGVGTRPDVECWVFDVDGCLVDSLTGTSLRPLARQLLEHLGRTSRVLLWSAGGGAYAKERAEQFRMDSHVSGYFSKEGRDRDGCYGIAHLSVDPGRTVFVDDRPEDLARDLRVITVSPYLSDDPHDRGLEGIAHRGGLPRSPGL